MSNPRSMLLDNDFLSDVRVRALFLKYGEVAIGRIVHLWTRFNDEGGRMKSVYARLLGSMIGVADNEWTEFLVSVLELELVRADGDYYEIPRLISDSQRVENKQKKWRDEKRRQRAQKSNVRETSARTSEEEKEQEEEQEKGGSKGETKPEPMDPDGKVLMTQAEAERLVKALGNEQFDYLIASAADFAKTKPKMWATYKDHAAFIRNQAKRKREEGKVFFNHPRDGPGFYPSWVVEKFERQNTQ